MDEDMLTMYERASGWTAEKISGVSHLDAPTPCDDWNMRDLLNHMLETQRYFISAARGEAASPPGANPPDLLTDDPAADFARARSEVLDAFGPREVRDKTGPALGIAFSDQLLHGWDVARATGQDERMPDGMPQAAYNMIYGRFTDEQRKGVFKPEVPLDPDATPQQRLLAYTGRPPS
jgi:uncharacterized protein (TIGR03086 family)